MPARTSTSLLAAALTLAATAQLAHAELKVASLFSDHMVLQRDMPDTVWGWSTPNDSIQVTAGTHHATAVAGPNGRWIAKLGPLPASDEPMNVVIQSKSDTITLHDVLVGDVWLSGGQSNMQFWLAEANGGKAAMADAPHHPLIRFYSENGQPAFSPAIEPHGRWELNTPEMAQRASAVAYFFALDIQQAEHVPIGLIQTAIGGSPAEAWTSAEVLRSNPQLKHYADARDESERNQPQIKRVHDEWLKDYGNAFFAAAGKWREAEADAKKNNRPVPPPPRPGAPEPLAPMWFKTPTVLYNGFIAPIAGYTIKGVIWYQGEDNTNPMPNAELYDTLFPAMIADWRQRWGQGNFPFLYVQLANFMGRPQQPVDTGWARVRDAQRRTLQASPNTGMAVAIDLGQNNDIHPKDKADVGHRLARAARRVAYGEHDLVAWGPLYKSMSRDGSAIRIQFDSVGSGLTIGIGPTTQPGVAPAAPASTLHGFSIAGPDKQFVWAEAHIEGDQVVVSSPRVANPVAVRYGWADDPDVNLYNKEGLPASPFRTDDWPASR